VSTAKDNVKQSRNDLNGCITNKPVKQLYPYSSDARNETTTGCTNGAGDIELVTDVQPATKHVVLEQ
jgi:hypothetical protein